MKEVSLAEVMEKYFKTHEICTMQQLYHYVDDYKKKYKCYVPYDRDEIDYILYTLGRKKYYWDNQYEVIRRQEFITCPCCGSEYSMYGDDSQKYFNVLTFITEEEEKERNNHE